MSKLRMIPPSPDVMRLLYEEYRREGQPARITFEQYLQVIGFTNPSEDNYGMDDGVMFRGAAAIGGPELVSLPSQAVEGPLHVMVLLVDFSDRVGRKPSEHYEELLFSKNTHPTGSMRDYFNEVSLGKVDVIGQVYGWLRLPHKYTYYTNNQSGTGQTYPRNAQRMAEDAVRAALNDGVVFDSNLDALEQGAVTALFIVHAGVGAETQSAGSERRNNIWSHKWVIPNPVTVGNNLRVNRYLTVPNDARLGVAAHELGHLAFQWEDFYDPNYARDGNAWDGSGDWDLMAGGSYNGSSTSPAHPMAWHKSQHDWIELEEVRSSKRLSLDPFTATAGKAYKLISSKYRANQYLILENRTRFGFDSYLPGEGLLVWRVDESKKMFAPQQPALLLIQADGRHELESVGDDNAGDSGDPFPGSTRRTRLFDSGNISTSFPDGDYSGIVLKNIHRDPNTGRITLEAEFDSEPVPDIPPDPPIDPPTPLVVRGESTPWLDIPDSDTEGIQDIITLTEGGTVRGITIAIDIAHTYIGDLRVELEAPSGHRAILHNRTGRNTHNLVKTYSSTDTVSLQPLLDSSVAGEWKLHVSDSNRWDTGTLSRWGLAIDRALEERGVHKKSAPELPIPDNDPSGISDVIQVAHSGTVRSISVGVDIAHTYAGDLRVELVAPTGKRSVLHNVSKGNKTKDLKREWKSTKTNALAVFVGIPVQGDWVLRVSDHLGEDQGTLNEWTLDVDLGSGVQTVEKTVVPDLVIPDFDSAGVSRYIVIDEPGTLQTIETQVVITHSYIGDLRIELISPSGESAILHDKSGGKKKDLNLQLDSADSQLLAGLVGQPIRGNWVLRVIDLEPQDEGVLDRWSLKLTYTE